MRVPHLLLLFATLLSGCNDESQPPASPMDSNAPGASAARTTPGGLDEHSTQKEALDPAVQEVIERRLRAVERNPSTSTTHRSLGLAYQANGAWTRAIAAFRKTLKLNPVDHAARLHLAVCLSLAGGNQESIKHLEHVVKAQPDGPAALYRLGVGYLKAGRFSEARKRFLAVSTLMPDNPHGHLGLGEVAMEDGNARAALVHLEKARTTGKGNEFVDFALGQCLAELGREMEAMPLLSQGADAARPQIGDSLSQEMSRYGVSRSALLGRAADLHQTGDPTAAMGILERLAKDYPEDLVVLNNLAAAYMALNREDPALATLNHVLEIKSTQHSAWFNISSIHFDRAIAVLGSDPQAAQSHLVKALAAADNAVRHGGHLARMHTMRGKVLMIMNSRSEAIAELGESIRLGTNNEDVYLNSAKLMVATQRHEEAFRLLLGALQKHADWVEVRFLCMPFFINQKDTINARRLLHEITNLAPKDKRLPALRTLLTRNGL